MTKGFQLGVLLASSVIGTPLLASDLYVNFNGQHVVNGQLSQFNALVVDEGRVVAVGQRQSLVAKHPKANQIDLQGAQLLPGLIDGHGHVVGLGLSLMQVDLRGAKSAKQAAERVQQYASNNPEDSWIKGRGWNQVLWPGKAFPTRADLDVISADKPIWLRRIDGHAGWANSKALQLAGITKETQAPAGGEIIRDKSGEPTGILVDNAMDLLEQHIPPLSLAETEKAIILATNKLASVGLTSVHDAGISATMYQAYQRLHQQQRLPIRIYAMLSAQEPQLPQLLAKGKITPKDDILSIRSIKISSDGALGSRGAALKAPYSDKPGHHGLMLLSEDKLASLYKQALAADFQINVHAIGDKANSVVLDLFEQLDGKHSGGHRHRIEHAQVVSVDELSRFKKIGVIASMQATHATSDKNMAGDRLGKQRLKGAYAWRTLLDDEVKIVGGSDFPIEYANPFYGLHASVTRQDRDNQPAGGWFPDQSMTLTEALVSFTTDAAYGAFQEDKLGSLEVGKWADFILVDKNVAAISPSQLWQPDVMATYVAGKAIYYSEDQ